VAVAEVTALSASSISVRICWQRSKKLAPSPVKLTKRVERVNNLTPSSCSRRAIDLLMAEEVSPSLWAARVKLRVSATLTKTSSALRFRMAKSLLMNQIQ
jgi:hypothetical protein